MSVRLHWLGFAFAFAFACAVALVGCFHPAIEDGGFVCDSSQSQPCPSGFFCVAGFCRQSASGSGGGVADLSTGGGGGGGGAGGGGGGGQNDAMDMSHSHGGGDLSHSSPGDMASGGGSCAHSLCTTGVKLTNGCDPCVTQICAQDNYCCVTKWSSQCVQEVVSICNQTCP